MKNYMGMIPFTAPRGAIMLDIDAVPVATDFVPFKIDKSSLFGGGGRSNVGDSADAETGTCCPWEEYKL